MLPEFDLSSPALALGSAALIGFATGIIPIGAAEAAALAIGLVSPRWLALAMCVVFTLAHVGAKLPWYWLGGHAKRVSGERGAKYLLRARQMLAERPQYGGGLLLMSALLSVPPFHLAAIAAGLTRMAIVPFITACFAGRLVRFGVLVTAPQLLRHLFG